MSAFYLFNSQQELDERGHYLFATLRKFIADHPGERVRVKWDVYSDPRSLNQNALYWMWVDRVAGHFTDKNQRNYSKDYFHVRFRHKWLGYSALTFDEDASFIIADQLRSTTSLDKGEFHRYLEQIDAWCSDVGLLLPYPDHSEYAKLKEASTR